MTDLATLSRADQSAIMDRIIGVGDLAKLSPADRSDYYMNVCTSLGLNPLTRPFEYIELDGKLTLYARRDATDQLRKAQGISITITERSRIDGLYIVTARAVAPDGRTDEATGVVVLEKEGGEWKSAQNGRRYFAGNGTFTPLRGADLANALMKAETKAKRRVTLSICGLGWVSEDELDTIRYQAVRVDPATGEILDQPAQTAQPRQPPARLPAPRPAPAQADDPLAPLRAEVRKLRTEARALGVHLVDFGENPTVDEIREVIKLQRAANDAAMAEDAGGASFTPPDEQEPAPLAA